MHIGRLLEGVRQQTIKDVEIILVDSGSTDDTIAIAESFHAKVVHIAPQDFTFGCSLNLGMNAATKELAVIASAHIYPVYPDWLERLLEAFNDSTIALSYGKQQGSPSSNTGRRSPSLSKLQKNEPSKIVPQTKFSEHDFFARWFPEHSDPKQSHPFCNNANAAIRRTLWEAHPYDETPQGVFNRYRREAMAFKKIYPEAHFSLYDFIRMTSSNILNDLWHAAKQKNIQQLFKHFLVSLEPFPQYPHRLSAVAGMELAAAPDFLLSTRYRN